MNTMLNAMREQASYKQTENGGVAYSSTLNYVLDMFALGAAYRSRSDEDCILLFKNAVEQDADLALKCLFYISDCRGGQGERRFFRVCFKWLANEYPETARRNIRLIPIYRRWDDVLYSCVGTPIEKDALDFIKKQLVLDMQCKTPSLLAKWLPSENASSKETKKMGAIVRESLHATHKTYRTVLSDLRSKINIVEKLMSENRWNEIEFDKLPSKAGFVYKNAFARHDMNRRYEEFANNKETKVNAGTLYPYEIVAKACSLFNYYGQFNRDKTDRLMIDKYWDNLPDYFDGKQSNMLCVVDTSGSMTGRSASAPINVAISLGIYAAERAGGPFKDHYISFSSRPKLIKVEGVDFADKVARIYRTNLCDNTDLTATFDMLLKMADRADVREEDIPETIVVISDMEIDRGTNGWTSCNSAWNTNTAVTEMEKVRQKWAAHGHKMPKLVYWNVDARQNTILDRGPGVSFVSGMSPTIFKTIITGKTGVMLMKEALLSERYEDVKW